LTRIQLRKSVDRGATFPFTTQVAAFSADSINCGQDGQNHPSIAVDTSEGPSRGNVYVAFVDIDADDDSCDIMLARSTDGGLSFDPPIRVNDDPPGSEQFFPWVAVDPSDGNVSVIWYDQRFNRPGLGLLTDVFLAESADGGVTWSRNRPLTDVPSRHFDIDSDAGPEFGDYINAVVADGVLYTAWADGRNGDPDVFFARVPRRRQ
jgi:hypothetical protein